jgi:hypothetical protein
VAPRARTAAFVATAIAVVVILVLWVFPGYLSVSTGCSSGVAVNDRTYHCETVVVSSPTLNCPFLTNGTWNGPSLSESFSSFTFHLAVWICHSLAGTAVSVTQPNGTTFWGGTAFGGPYTPGNPGSHWFAPDNESGIYQASFDDKNITLYVEVGT